MSKQLQQVYSTFRYRRDEAERRWNELVALARQNPNQMNVHGIWQADQLRELQFLHIFINTYDGVLFDLRQVLGLPEEKEEPAARVERLKEGRPLVPRGMKGTKTSRKTAKKRVKLVKPKTRARLMDPACVRGHVPDCDCP